MSDAPLEIERRWLLVGDFVPINFPDQYSQVLIRQGYFEQASPNRSIRIRASVAPDGLPPQFFLTVKSGSGIVRTEVEVRLPEGSMTSQLLEQCDHIIEKTRIKAKGWEIDEFAHALDGIVIIERELTDPNEEVVFPSWLPKEHMIEVTDSLTNLHLARIATELARTGNAPLPRIQQHIGPRIPRIVITGGPCSGKSSMMRMFKAEFSDIQFVPEVATLLVTQVGITPGTTPEDLRRFQRTIWRTQKLLEETSAEFAASCGKRAIVFDRGSIDNAAYLSGGIEEFQKIFDTSYLREYDNYDLVIYLSRPPAEVYEREKANNPARGETYEQACEVGLRTLKAWGFHQNMHIAGTSYDTWDQKVAHARNLIKDLLT